jgi:hypothetical protein
MEADGKVETGMTSDKPLGRKIEGGALLFDFTKQPPDENTERNGSEVDHLGAIRFS